MLTYNGATYTWQGRELRKITIGSNTCSTDKGLLPCARDGGCRRVFNAESVNWMQGLQCLKGCGASIQDIRAYYRLCLPEESEENLRARYAIILKQPITGWRKPCHCPV